MNSFCMNSDMYAEYRFRCTTSCQHNLLHLKTYDHLFV